MAKFGEGYTKYKKHGSGAGYDASGEVLVETMLSVPLNLGMYSEGSVFKNESTIVEDEIEQEINPVQQIITGKKASFTVRMSMGDAAFVAIACGYSEAKDAVIGGRPAKIAPLGCLKPEFLTLLHSVPNSNNRSLEDHYYMPKVQVEPAVELKFGKGIRETDVTFNVMASQQVMMENPYGFHEAVKLFYETDATFDKVLRYDKEITAVASEWNLEHGFNKGLAACQFENSSVAVIEPGSVQVLNDNYQKAKLSESLTGKAVAFAPAVASDVASTGRSELHHIYNKSTIWTLTAKNFAYSTAAIVICLNEYGEVIEAGSVEINAGAIGAGTIVCSFSKAQRGQALVFAEGPNGYLAQSHVSQIQWVIDTSEMIKPVMIQVYDNNGFMVEPGSIEYNDTLDQLEINFSEAFSGVYLAIY